MPAALLLWVATGLGQPSLIAPNSQPYTGHPRLFFTGEELTRLRGLRTQGLHAQIWKQLASSADWCLTQKPRTEWIAPVSPDPIYENLYDRFYAMMHDMAIVEHLAFVFSYSGDERYFDAARQWTLAACRIWKREADGNPDASKAYAVTRILKGVAVAYDQLHDRLPAEEREEIRRTMADITRKYIAFFRDPGAAGPGYDKHHGSVEASSLGLVALALLGEVPQAGDWLDLMIKKHADFLLPSALTPSGTQEQSSNYWASTMQYRLFFLDALRRVTGRDLFSPYAKALDGRIALAAIAGTFEGGAGEDQQSILFAPSYGQLDYWSPVLLYLAREYRRPIYQHLALWDHSLGAIQQTRYRTNHGEQLLFELGGYAYAWYDPAVPDRIEDHLPRSFLFPEVNEVYMRSSYEPHALVIALRNGILIVHAGGQTILVEEIDAASPPKAAEKLSVDEIDNTLVMRCRQAAGAVPLEQVVTLESHNRLTIHRKTDSVMRWWCHGQPRRDSRALIWPDGVQLRVMKGNLSSFEPKGYQDEKIVGLGKLKLTDPTPKSYPRITATPDGGELLLLVETTHDSGSRVSGR